MSSSDESSATEHGGRLSTKERSDLIALLFVVIVGLLTIATVLVVQKDWDNDRWVAIGALSAFVQAIAVVVGVPLAIRQVGVQRTIAAESMSQATDAALREAVYFRMEELSTEVGEDVQRMSDLIHLAHNGLDDGGEVKSDRLAEARAEYRWRVERCTRDCQRLISECDALTFMLKSRGPGQSELRELRRSLADLIDALVPTLGQTVSTGGDALVRCWYACSEGWVDLKAALDSRQQ